MKRIFGILTIFLAFLMMNLGGCGNSKSDRYHHGNDLDTLKVVTLYGPTSYFNYRGEPMGIDYDNARKFAEDEGLVMEITTVNNIPDLIDKLKSGEAHLAAYPLPAIAEYKEEVLHCGPVEISNQVLVQKKGKNEIHDVTELIGKEIYVEKDSKYHYRLLNLNDELGGGIKIIPFESDTIESEDLLRLVNNEVWQYTVIDSQLASLYKGSFPQLDTSLKISSDQAASWAVGLGLDSLAAKIDRWENRTHSSEFIKDIYKRYYDNNLNEIYDANLDYFKKMNLSKGKPVSAYDPLFKKYADRSGYDWKLLAAIAFCESRFNPSVASRFGAFGLMQVMPNTAEAVGVEPGSLGNPDSNVLAATRIISKLDKALSDKIEDPEERMKFVVASYNSGLGHIYDSIALAQKHGLDPQKWTGNVSISALMKSRPEYYNDPVVKHGYFRGRETVDFVDHVIGIYNYLQSVLQ
ncbi:MAG: transglycosylase SLT domain-containing protein [Muribaculaceae bacterium]|nr:transglycosylase SLT domain-containing protein [Muribaculaceae bacterium]